MIPVKAYTLANGSTKGYTQYSTMILKRFYGFVFRHRGVFTLASASVVAYSILSNLVPLALRNVVNNIQDSQTDAAITAFMLMIVLKVAEMLMSNISQYIADYVGIVSTADARQAVFKHLHDLDFQYHANKSSGKLLGIFKRGENAFMQYYVEINYHGLKAILDFGFLLVIFSQIYPRLLYFSAFIFILNAIIMYFTVRYNISERKKFIDVDDELTVVTVDNVVAFDTIKYFAGEEREQNKLSMLMKRYNHAFMRYVITFRVIDLANGGLLAAGSIGMIGIAMFDLIHNSINIGDFVLVVSFSTTFAAEMRGLVLRIRNLAKLHTDLTDYLEILDEKIAVEDTIDPHYQSTWEKSVLESPEGVSIEFRNVSFGYHGTRKTALHNINVTIKPNESVAFVGVSGVGKTTLTKLLMRFYDPTDGEIFVNDVPIHKIAKSNLRKAMGIVPQEAVLFNHSIGDNILYGAQHKGPKALQDALKMAHLDGFVHSLPQGIDTLVGERGIKLSGGQKQRLAIARAFMKDAPIIIFDEATSNLDSESERLIQDAFWKLAKNKTTIIIAHRLSTIQKVDRIIVFDNGTIVEEGTHQELAQKQSGLYKHLWSLQSSGEID